MPRSIIGRSAIRRDSGTGSGGPPSGPAGGDLAGTYPNPLVIAIEETSTPARLAIAAIPDGDLLARSGLFVVGVPPAAAAWPLATTRFFALDFTGGLDANAGFSDVSMAAAGAVAKKTWAALFAIIPPVGANHIAVVAIKRRDASGTSYGENFFFRGVTGYQDFDIVATTDFSDTATDRILSGAVIGSAGPNGDSSWTVAGGALISNFAVAAGVLPAEPGITGMRVRFKGNVTAALTNQCRMVWFNDASNIQPENPLSAIPVAGDEFFIERPGVTFDDCQSNYSGGNVSLANPEPISFRVRGLRSLANFQWQGSSDASFSFCEAAMAAVFENFNFLELNSSFVDSALVSSIVGAAVRSPAVAVGLVGVLNIATAVAGYGFGLIMVDDGINANTFQGSVFIGSLAIDSLHGFNINAPSYLGSGQSTGNDVRPLRVFGGGGIGFNGNSTVAVNGATIDGSGSAAIAIVGTGGTYKFDNLSGSGNASGLDLASSGSAVKNVVDVGALVTLNGAFGTILLPGGAVSNWNDIIELTNVVDRAGNEVFSSAGAGHVVSACRLVTNRLSAIATGQIARVTGNNSVTIADASTSANATGVLGVAVTPGAADDPIYMADAGSLRVRMDAAPTFGNLVYLSEATAGNGRDTPPPVAGTNQKLRHGYVEDALVVGGIDYAVVPWQTELVPVLSNGIAP